MALALGPRWAFGAPQCGFPWPRTRKVPCLQAKFEQFTTDAFRAPVLVLKGHLSDERHEGVSDWRPMRLPPRFGLEFSDTAEHLAMPAQQCVRLDDEERFLPSAQSAPQ